MSASNAPAHGGILSSNIQASGKAAKRPCSFQAGSSRRFTSQTPFKFASHAQQKAAAESCLPAAAYAGI
jgi:hypothetical protein